MVNRFSEPVHTTPVATAIDIHQHLWPEPLLRALSERREPPRLVRAAEGWTLRLAGEPDAPVDLADHDPDRRAALAEADGLGRVLIAPSVPLGIEALPARQAEPLLEAYHAGLAALPAPFGGWAAIGTDAPDPDALGRRVRRRRVAGRARRLRAPGPAAGDARARRGPVARPSRASRCAARRAAVVGRAHRLRGGDAGGLVRVRRLGPSGPPEAARVLRDARGPGAAAPRAADGPRRPRRRRSRRVPRRLLLRGPRGRRRGARDRRRPTRLRLRPARRRAPRAVAWRRGARRHPRAQSRAAAERRRRGG